MSADCIGTCSFLLSIVYLSIDGWICAETVTFYAHQIPYLRDCHLIECDIHVSIGELINPSLRWIAFIRQQVLSIIIISNSGNN